MKKRIKCGNMGKKKPFPTSPYYDGYEIVAFYDEKKSKNAKGDQT